MFLRSFVAVTLFTSWLGAAEEANSNVFSVRSFRAIPHPNEMIPFSGRFLENGEPKRPAAEAEGVHKCAIPLLELRAGKTGDRIGRPAGKIDNSLVIAPPAPVCENWNHDQSRPAPAPTYRLH